MTGPINLGNPEEFTIRDFAELVIRLTNSRSEIVYNTTMKVLLAQPPVEDFYDTDVRLQPIGLCYLKAAVKQHLVNLYDKFEVGDDLTHRRTRLANDAIRRGAVTIADLRHGDAT